MTNKEVVKEFDGYLRLEKAENTRLAYMKNVDVFFNTIGDKYYKDINYDSLNVYKDFLLNSDISKRTYNAKMSAIITFLKFLYTENEIEKKLHDRLRLQSNANVNSNPYKVANVQDLKFILAYVKSLKFTFMNQRKKIIMMLFIFTGIRRDEMTNIKWSNVNFENKTIYIDKAKRNEFRNVKINDDLLRQLKWWRQLCEEKRLDSDYIVINGKNRPIGNRELNDLVKRVMSHLDMDYTPHCLRKGCATMLSASGYDLSQIQQLLGHSSISVTELYVKPTFDSNMAEDNILTK